MAERIKSGKAAKSQKFYNKQGIHYEIKCSSAPKQEVNVK